MIGIGSGKSMRYEGKLYRPPSEARSYILQATIGCSHNLCTYCDMYRDKKYRVRSLDECLEDIKMAKSRFRGMNKVFVADGDALAMGMDHWLPILAALKDAFPNLRQVSCYATAENLLEKTPDELTALREAGLRLLYIGPESGDPATLKQIVKGNSFEDHVVAADKAHAADMKISVIMLLGAGGAKLTTQHGSGSAKLITAMNPEFFAALTLTIVPGTPIDRMAAKGGFTMPSTEELLTELRTMVNDSRPTDTVFRTNHASNYLPTSGRLPQDRESIVKVIDSALAGDIALRPDHVRSI